MSIPAAIASHRFGLSEPSLDRVGNNPRAWVLAQLRNPTPLDTRGLLTTTDATRLTGELVRQLRAIGQGGNTGAEAVRRETRAELRTHALRALQQRWQHQVSTPTPVFERWVLFWSNHFTVSATKATTLALVWPFENEAIRPHATGRFVDLLRASTVHPGMLLYLDNAQSIGPGSRLGRRRERGLNENLARELLELHTVGVNAGYTQTDVTELARLLTGWTTGRLGQDEAGFVNAVHEPGPKRVMGRVYPEGPDALDAVLNDLARHPATAQHIAQRLAQHFVADQPPAALVKSVAQRFSDTDGDLLATAVALFEHELAWQPAVPDAPGKARRPEELLVGLHRLLQSPPSPPQRWLSELDAMGQPVGRAPSPQGWPDRQDDWLGPDALLKRVEWASEVGRTTGGQVDARALARQAWGEALSANTRSQIDRADSGAQALALLLASPEFQRR